jgi:hypothetical protein
LLLGVEHAIDNKPTDQTSYHLGVLTEEVPVPEVVEDVKDVRGLDVRVGKEPGEGHEGVLELESLFLVEQVAVVERFGEGFEMGVDVGLVGAFFF